ncbi:MAG: radical SAM/SPASM domain-containing protein [Magnetococcales bacterium]|nr:radical SAM/SPASM domain-containing protein [Magnetococcales bacterium]
MAKYLDSFLEHRLDQERKHISAIEDNNDPINSLITVEMNITELCNRVCSFCPRVDSRIYPNRNLSMDLKISKKVAADLEGVNYKGRVSFSGYGEPILNKEFAEHIKIFRDALPDNIIETNTNGDKLTVKMIKQFFAAGITALYVNLYDGPQQVQYFKNLFLQAGISIDCYKLRYHWEGVADDCGLTINNRSGMLKFDKKQIDSQTFPINNPCYYPFYKMLVDYNGDVMFCANDWGRNNIVGNVLKSYVRDIWLSKKMQEIRLRLIDSDRNFKPCNICDIQGTLHGKSSVDRLVTYYAQQK